MTNIVLVSKSSNKWCMRADFTDLNTACLKDPYHLSNIDILIDGSSGYKTLSFKNSYWYNWIKMDLVDAPKITFISNHGNYYNGMPFGLKNASVTYERLMDVVFSKQIGRNMEFYIDDIIVKTSEGRIHVADLEDILESVKRYNMQLNPTKCSFEIHTSKFLGFMLIRRWIEVNPYRFHSIINMRSSSNVKEVQRLTGRLILPSLFHFLCR